MKVLLVNGSPKANGNTARALAEVAEQLHAEGIDTEVFQLGAKPIRDCIGCGQCGKLDCRCTFDDDVVNELIAAAEQADGFVFGSPVYYAHPSGRILSALDRAFYAGGHAFEHKPGAAVAVARRGGTSTTFDVLNKYFTIKQMPVVASTYWNNVFGRVPGDADGDAEGLATMRNIGKNMAWLLRCIEAGQAAGINAPEADRATTNFIRQSGGTMNIQIFGTKKSFDTKKAQRYFKERRIKVQFIDLKEKEMSKGELTSVMQAVGGIDKLLNPKAKDEETLALIQHLTPSQRFDKLLENQQVLAEPIVRNGKKATVGYCPDVWGAWE